MPASEETVTYAAIVRGRVRAVGFRYFVYSHAQHLGLAGWVRNRPDGGVEVVARGPRDAIDVLRAALHQGPHLARVESVTEDWPEGTLDIPAGFEIR